MTVSKEIAKKVERLNEIEAEAEKLRAELRGELGDYFDGCYMNGYYIADEPCGDEQHDGARGGYINEDEYSAVKKLAGDIFRHTNKADKIINILTACFDVKGGV